MPSGTSRILRSKAVEIHRGADHTITRLAGGGWTLSIAIAERRSESEEIGMFHGWGGG